MGILHPDQRDYPATQGAPLHSSAVPAQQPVSGSHFGGNGGVGYQNAGVGADTHIPLTQTTATGPAPNTAGPHRHDILNKLDPSVDSNLSNPTSGAASAGTVNNAGATGHHGVSPAVAAGVGAGAGAGAAHHHNHHGHNANGGLGVAGSGGGLTGSRQQPVPVTNASTATGPAPNTAGPHRSDVANRLDPTVDSHTGLRK